MNSMIGKSTGIALLMAAALLAALFAMGVFSATGVGADPSHDDQDTAHMAQLNTLVVVEGAVPTSDPNASTGTIFPEGFTTAEDQEETEYVVSPTRAATNLVFAINAAEESRVSSISVYGLTAEQELDASTLYAGFAAADSLVELESITEEAGATDNTLALDIDLTKAIVTRVEITVVDDEPVTARVAGIVAHDPQTYTVTIQHNTDATNSSTAGAGVRLNLRAMLRADIDDEITIDLAGFGVPSSIEEDLITIQGTDGTKENPSDVSVSGSKISIVLPDLDPDGDSPDADSMNLGATSDDATPVVTKEMTTIRISNKAGITNPVNQGKYAIKISDSDFPGASADVDAANIAEVVRTISIDPKSGASGNEVTVTGKGYNNGQARIFIDAPAIEDDPATTAVDEADDTGVGDFDSRDTVLGSATISGGSFTFTTTGITETSYINAYDLDLGVASKNAKYNLSQSISISPEDVSKTDEITITLKDWDEVSLGRVTSVSFTGAADVMSADFVSYKPTENDDEYQIKLKVPTGADTGQVKVSVRVNGITEGSANINVETLALTVVPDTAVPGQSISIRGSDFSKGADIGDSEAEEPGYVKVAGVTIDDLSENVDQNGNIDITVTVPETAKSGDRSVEVVDDGGRVGKADLTVSAPTLTIDPAESRIGTTVTVEGTGFPANDLVLIEYDGNAVASSATTATGSFRQDITVPGTANIGEKHNITAEPQVQDESVNEADAVKHSTPDPTISFNPASAVPGSTITVSGENFRPFAGMDTVTIGNRELSIASVSVGADGSFTTPALTVPLVTPNNYLVTVVAKEVADGQANEYLSVVEAVEEVSTDPAEVFAPLVEAGRLARVWYQDRATQDWTFYDPDPAFASFNRLNEVSSGQVVTIIITDGEPIPFQGETLYQGSNSIALD